MSKFVLIYAKRTTTYSLRSRCLLENKGCSSKLVLIIQFFFFILILKWIEVIPGKVVFGSVIFHLFSQIEQMSEISGILIKQGFYFPHHFSYEPSAEIFRWQHTRKCLYNRWGQIKSKELLLFIFDTMKKLHNSYSTINEGGFFSPKLFAFKTLY